MRSIFFQFLTLYSASINALNLKPSIQNSFYQTRSSSLIVKAQTFQAPSDESTAQATSQHCKIGPTLNKPIPPPVPEHLIKAFESNSHPEETQAELGTGIFFTEDWRKAWFSYGSPIEDPSLIDPVTGEAEYEISEIDGQLPDDLVGVLYRNGPGKFGLNGERVVHVLDADGLILKIHFMEPDSRGKRKVMFRSKFVETKAFREEATANKFIYRGTFGTAPRGLDNIFPPERNGINEDPPSTPAFLKVIGNAFNTDIKNTANTQVISFGGKLLALFEAGLPHRLDPESLDTFGEDDLGGELSRGLPVKVPSIPKEYAPDFINGSAFTAHPNVCPRTGHLVGWYHSSLPAENCLEVTIVEWEPTKFQKIASETYKIPNCELAPHDMSLTENYVVLLVNALSLNQMEFMSGLNGPAASLKMEGREDVVAWVLPRPTSKLIKEQDIQPFSMKVPPNFSIHGSHAYEDIENQKIVVMFSGWPPSDSKTFLGAWGGFAPEFDKIPITYLWRLEIPLNGKGSTKLQIAHGSANANAEHPLIHPNFQTRKVDNVYATISNDVGDATAPTGYVRLEVEKVSDKVLPIGEKNKELDVYWCGTRSFVGEPIIVPKKGGDKEMEREAYLLGMVYDAVRDRSYVAIFDLEKDLSEGPVCRVWMKSAIPHGLHGCFVEDNNDETSWFC